MAINPTKKLLVDKLRRYLNHKNILATRSNYYKRADIAHAIGKLNSTFKNALKDCQAYDLKGICGSIVQHKEDLLLILPNANNTSYQSSFDNINEILSIANEYLTGRQVKAVDTSGDQ